MRARCAAAVSRCAVRTLLAAGCAATVALAAPAQALTPSIDSVTPLRVGDVLEASLRTSHFPGDRLTASLKSGLPAAIEMQLVAVDQKNHEVAEHRLFLRIAWDLWDEVVKVDGVGEPRQLDSLASLEGFLADLEGLPVGAMAALEPRTPHRVRVDCRLHPVAPRETERLTRWVAGGEEATSGRGADDREVSVGLSDVIRFFYKGGQKDADEMDPRFSAWFVPAELPEGGAK